MPSLRFAGLIGYLIMAVGYKFGLTSGNRSDTFMLFGGDKSSQVADIAIAKQLARNLKGCLQ
jgi:putative component of toxin-antitoxin plasmid stabilization module